MHCIALAYAIIFSLGISWISWQANAEVVGGRNFCQWRHGGAGSAWNGASLGFKLVHALGSWNEALTCCANFLVSTCGTVDNSAYQLGTSHLWLSITPIQQAEIWVALSIFPHCPPLQFQMSIVGRRPLQPGVEVGLPSLNLCLWTLFC